MATTLDMQILEDGKLSPASGSDLGGGVSQETGELRLPCSLKPGGPWAQEAWPNTQLATFAVILGDLQRPFCLRHWNSVIL